MSKRKGLGTDITKSEEMLDGLRTALKSFDHMPLKKGLRTNKVDDEAFFKLVNQASETALTLINQIDDIQGKLKGVRDPATRSPRFASASVVVKKFLDGDSSL